MKIIKLNTQKITFRLTLNYTMFFFITLILMSGITLFSVKYYIYNQSFDRLENINETIKHTLKTNSTLNNIDINDISQMNENIDLNIRKNDKVTFSTGETYDFSIPNDITVKPKSFVIGENNLIYNNDEFKNGNNEVIHIQIIKDMDNEDELYQFFFGY